MKDFADSTLWRVSEFERARLANGGSAFARLDGATVLPTTLLADLDRLDAGGASDDPLEVAAACVRHHEPALLCLQYDGLVWPVTLFPAQDLYHSPRDIAQALPGSLARLRLLSTEPAGVKPPGHWMHERIGLADHYRPLGPLVWALALHGPRSRPLAEIAGTAAYRALKNPEADGVTIGGPLRSAAQRLRRETVSLRDVAGWPGMSVERAGRLLNGLYLNSSLMVTRAHPAARGGSTGGWLDRLRGTKRQP
jgi:hypothetical protein